MNKRFLSLFSILIIFHMASNLAPIERYKLSNAFSKSPNKSLKIEAKEKKSILQNNNNSEFDLVSISNGVVQPASSITPVYTPNGTAVGVSSYEELSAEVIASNNNYADSIVPEATRLSPSSKKYNCHSYAWYWPSTLNTYWMPNPQFYIIDGSYSESEGEIGDIICYLDQDGNNIHSGIVVGKIEGISNGICGNANLVTVESKWGDYGLYNHRGDQCLYTSPYGGRAVSVKYYEPRNQGITPLYNPDEGVDGNIDSYYPIRQNDAPRNRYCLTKLEILDIKQYAFQVISNHELDVRLYDNQMQLINISKTVTVENGTHKVAFNHHLLYPAYYLRVAYSNSSDYGTIHTKIINQHDHLYRKNYTWYNHTRHKAHCDCGTYRLEGHVVSSDAFGSGNQYAQCLICKGPASMGFARPSSLISFLTTSNGSFVLPNGVVVLDERDYEAYINGSFKFNTTNGMELTSRKK